MFKQLFLIMFVTTLLEMYVLIQVGGVLGAIPTIALIFVTAFVGAKFVRSQGMATWQQLQSGMTKGQSPEQTLVEGLMLIIAGVLLVTPGFVTDTLGLLTLVPQIRARWAKYLSQYLVSKMSSGATMGFGQMGGMQGFGSHQDPFQQAEHVEPQPHSTGAKKTTNKRPSVVVEGEYTRKSDQER